MSDQQKFNRLRKSAKRVSFGVPRSAKLCSKAETKEAFFPVEDWHEPVTGERDGYRIIEQDPGEGLLHPLSPADISARLRQLPDWALEDLDVVQLSRVTRKKSLFPCYGLQWGTAIYLYPVEESLHEVYTAPPRPALYNETRMYGGKWIQDDARKLWILEWSETTIRDFYLNNVLIHELGHLVDDRNTSYQARERFADWFAIEYGYRPTRQDRSTINAGPNALRRRHHRC